MSLENQWDAMVSHLPLPLRFGVFLLGVSEHISSGFPPSSSIAFKKKKKSEYKIVKYKKGIHLLAVILRADYIISSLSI